MIINEKIIKFLDGDLDNLTINIKEKILNDEKIRIYSILKYFNFKELNYTFEDFLNDNYGKEIKEKKALYLLLSEYSSVTNFCIENNIDTANFTRLLKIGINKLPKSLYNEKNKFLKYFEMECDVSNFDVRLYKKHIELYARKDLLEEFRKEHKIKYPVRYDSIQEVWHLAFDGVLAEWIKYEMSKKKKG